MTFDVAAEGDISVTEGFSYTGFSGSGLVGPTRTLNTSNIEGGTTGTSADLGTVLWVGDGPTLTFSFPAGFRKFSFCYATHSPLGIEFYNGIVKVFEVSNASIPQTILGTGPTFDEWNALSISFPTTATSAVFVGTAFQYCVDMVTCGKLDPLGTL
jgi:hypothetical protein